MTILAVGDKVKTKRASVNTMLFYSKHKQGITCPCKWYPNTECTIIQVVDRFAYVVNIKGEKSVYSLLDLIKV